MTQNTNYLCTSKPSEVTKPIVQKVGTFYLQPSSVSIITVQAPT